ncbi:hypothetical protein B0H11DRAFT_2230073 [Mycena galericulata]|nr:hypothetical protein B0H11DRAFT_2230073 [Mycena galericulata]
MELEAQLTIRRLEHTFLGTFITFPTIVALWYSNTWNTGYLPFNSNHVYDNMRSLYTVSKAVGNTTLFDQALYDNYPPAYLAAGSGCKQQIYYCKACQQVDWDGHRLACNILTGRDIDYPENLGASSLSFLPSFTEIP